MKRIIMLAIVAALLAASAIPATMAGAQNAPPGCDKIRGTIVCTTTETGKNPQGKFVQAETTTVKGSFRAGEAGGQTVQTVEECKERPGQTTKCPPGQFN